MKSALNAAGIMSSRDRLEQAAREAIGASNRNHERALALLQAAVIDDASLLWELMMSDRERLMRALIYKMAAGGDGANRWVNASTRVSPASGGLPARASGEGGAVRVECEHQPQPDRPAVPRRTLAGVAAAAETVRRSILQTFLVNGQPIGSATVSEARAWARSRQRDAKFVELLTANLPDAAVIGERRSAEDADALYQQAESEHAKG